MKTRIKSTLTGSLLAISFVFTLTTTAAAFEFNNFAGNRFDQNFTQNRFDQNFNKRFKAANINGRFEAADFNRFDQNFNSRFEAANIQNRFQNTFENRFDNAAFDNDFSINVGNNRFDRSLS